MLDKSGWIFRADRSTAACYARCRGDRVIRYYALAMSSASHAGAPSRLRRAMPDPAPVALVVRLALDRTEQRRALGGHLLVDALLRSREFGARAVIAEAIDEQAGAFHRHYDFHQLDDRRLWRRLADVARALGE